MAIDKVIQWKKMPFSEGSSCQSSFKKIHIFT